MADAKITELTALTTPAAEDLLVIVDDVAGTPTTKKITLTDLMLLTMPSGSIQMFGGATAPTNWLLCDGASLLRASYTTLFGIIGTTFGSADGTHFNVPDFRGVFPKGAGTTDRTLGKDANANYYAATLGTYLTDKMQGHIHSVLGGDGNPMCRPTGGDTAYTNAYTYGYQTTGQTPAKTGGQLTDGTNGTPRTGMTTEPQSLGITFIIKT